MGSEEWTGNERGISGGMVFLTSFAKSGGKKNKQVELRVIELQASLREDVEM